ncbi:hypothetical protein K3495_g11110 [Podosphaera aphanis]|nr:hypothetical protein K3495_g11110 [Podosphaera aphanis]
MRSINISIRSEDGARAENCDPFNNISPDGASESSSSSINSAPLLFSRQTSTPTNSQFSTTSDFALAPQSVVPDLGLESQSDEISTSCTTSFHSAPSFSGSNNSMVGSFFLRNQNIVIVISSILSSVIIILICTLVLLILRHRNHKSRQCSFSQIPDRKSGSWCRRNSDTPENPKASISDVQGQVTANHISKENTIFQPGLRPITPTKKPSQAVLPMVSYSRTRLPNDDISAADLLIPKYSPDHSWKQLSASRLNIIQQSYGINRMGSWNSQNSPSLRVHDRETANDGLYAQLCDLDEEVRSEFSQLRADCSSPDTSIFDEISSIGTFRGGLAPRPVTRS